MVRLRNVEENGGKDENGSPTHRLTRAKSTSNTICGMPISTHSPTTGKPYAQNASPTAAIVGATTTGFIALHLTQNHSIIQFHSDSLLIQQISTVQYYLRSSAMAPLYPRKAWNADPIMIAPCSSLIVALNLCHKKLQKYEIVSLLNGKLIIQKGEWVHTSLERLAKSGEKVMASAGARQTNDAP